VASALKAAEDAVVSETDRAEQERSRAEQLKSQAQKNLERAERSESELDLVMAELEAKSKLWMASHGGHPEGKGDTAEAWKAADEAMRGLESALALSPKKAKQPDRPGTRTKT